MHRPSKKSQFKLYFLYRLSLAQAIGMEGCQPVTPVTNDNQSGVHKTKVITYKLDTRKDNQPPVKPLSWELDLLSWEI